MKKWCLARSGQRQRKDRKLDDDHPLTLDQVAERQQDKETQRIAQLGDGRDVASRLAGEVTRHQAQHRLVVVDVGHGQPRRQGHGEDQASAGDGDGGGRRGASGDRSAHRIVPLLSPPLVRRACRSVLNRPAVGVVG